MKKSPYQVVVEFTPQCDVSRAACTSPLARISIPILPPGTVTSSIDLLDTLKTVWSYSSLKPLQQKAIDSIFYGNDTMVIMPTGEGKSLVF